MSPLCTELLHEPGDSEHFGAIRLVRFEGGSLISESTAIPETIGSLHERRSDRL
jgi:hypothetical protein